MTTSAHERLCPQCGLELPPAGPCPHCLLRLALAKDDEDEPPVASVSPEKPQRRPPTGLQSRFFGDYEILDEVARGGMGVVYRARHLSLKRVVALKLIHASHLMSSEARLRFAMEVATAAQLNHPHIISLYESGEFKGVHFFTMRLVEGGDLSQHTRALSKGGGVAPLCAMPPLRSGEAIAALVSKCARALHYAHQRGILHRDLKPSNVLIDLQGEPHLADFGLAKMLARESATTFADSVLGSPNYMAPEQAAGLNAELTVATDVYGLGTVLYEALTGTPPFRAATPVETIRKVLDEEPVPPRRLKPGVDPDLETICLKCLEKKPSARYGTAELLAEDLERWEKGLPIVARPVGKVGLAWRWTKRHPAIVGLSAALVVALAASAVGAGLALIRIREAERRAVANLQESLLGQARGLSLSGEMGMRNEAVRLITQATSLGGTPEFRQRARDQMLGSLALADMAFAPQLPATGDMAHRLLDPAMERWATIRDQTNLVIQRTSDRTVLLYRAVSATPVVQLESFSADGRFLALRLRDGVSCWDVEAGREIFTTNGPRRLIAFALQAPRLALEEPDSSITIRELPDFRVLHRLEPEPDDTRRRAWQTLSLSPDGTMLAGTRSRENALELYDVETGRRRWRGTNASAVTALAWAPSRRQLAVGGADGAVRLWRWADGGSTLLYRAVGVVRSVAFARDATLLAIAGEDGLIRVVNMAAQRRAFYLKGDAGRIVFDPGGLRMGPVKRGPEIGWVELSRSAEFREFSVAGFSVEVGRCGFSPDSRMVVVGYPRTVALHRVGDGRMLTRVPVEQLPAFGFDPQGGALFTSDSKGVRRWALTEGEPGRMELAAPEIFLPGRGWRAFAFNANGDRFAVANMGTGAAFVFDRTLSNSLAMVGPQDGVNSLAVSPDGQWLATASAKTREVRAWNVRTLENVFTSGAETETQLEFSRDGRWLLTHGETFSLRAVSSWQEAPALPFSPDHLTRGPAAFSPDGRILAVVVDDFEVQLFDLVTWQPMGLLRPPALIRLCSLAFSPDGTRLAAGSTRGKLQMWMLDEIRDRLRDANLDWDLPPWPKSTAAHVMEVQKK